MQDSVGSMFRGGMELSISDGPGVSSENQTTSLSLDVSDPEAGVRSALRLAHSAPLPRVDEDTLLDYYRYLKDALSFPFVAQVCQDTGLVGKQVLDGRRHTITVLGLLNPARRRSETSAGLLCIGRKGGLVLEVPLAELEVEADDRNHRLLEDYWYWFWNCQ